MHCKLNAESCKDFEYEEKPYIQDGNYIFYIKDSEPLLEIRCNNGSLVMAWTSGSFIPPVLKQMAPLNKAIAKFIYCLS